jgi:hypothetical protein
MENWDILDTHDTNRHHPSTMAKQTENWDDDFEAETQNNSLRKPKFSTPRRREESWDDELEMEVKREESDQESGGGTGEDRTVTARSRAPH